MHKSIRIPPKPIAYRFDLVYQPLFTKHWQFIFLNLPAPIYYCTFHLFISGASHHPIYHRLQYQKQKLHLYIGVNGQLNQHYQCLDLNSDLVHSEPETTFFLSQLFNFFQAKQQINLNKNDKDLIFDFLLKIQSKIAILPLTHLSKQNTFLVELDGTIQYQNETISLERLGYLFSNKYLNFPLFKIYFYMRMIVEVEDQCLIFQQEQYNNSLIANKKVVIHQIKANKSKVYTGDIDYSLYSVFPRLEIADNKNLYIPKEYMWQLQTKKYQIQVNAKSRKDFKFSFGCGITDSFIADITINQEKYDQIVGYIEYIDVRSLIFEENKHKNINEILMDRLKSTCSTVKTHKISEK